MIVKIGGKVVAWENPFAKAADSMEKLNQKLDVALYWLNPLNWGKELWNTLDTAFRSGSLDIPFLEATIIGIILMMFGAQWPKKLVFWGWIAFWTLRALIFV